MGTRFFRPYGLERWVGDIFNKSSLGNWGWWQGGSPGPEGGDDFGRAREVGMVQGSSPAAVIGVGIIPLRIGMLESGRGTSLPLVQTKEGTGFKLRIN